MFKKREPESEGISPMSAFPGPQPAPQPASPGARALNADDQDVSVIGYALSVNGELNTANSLRINGEAKGTIRARTITVGQDAIVEADLIAEEIVIAGTVNGKILAEQVRLCNTAQVTAEICHHLFAIETGAQFEGTVQRVKDPLGQENVPWADREDPRPAPEEREEEDMATAQPGAPSGRLDNDDDESVW